jgi:hypothetical protein
MNKLDGDDLARFEAWFATNKEHAYGWSPRYAALEGWQAALASNKAPQDGNERALGDLKFIAKTLEADGDFTNANRITNAIAALASNKAAAELLAQVASCSRADPNGKKPWNIDKRWITVNVPGELMDKIDAARSQGGDKP